MFLPLYKGREALIEKRKPDLETKKHNITDSLPITFHRQSRSQGYVVK